MNKKNTPELTGLSELSELTGLTPTEVLTREKSGQINGNCNIPSKSIAEIIKTNTLTFFNLLILGLGAAVFLTGEYKNMLFLGVIFANTLIGIFQELRAKRAIDRLSLISAARATAIRGGETCEIPVEKIVLDDVLLLSEGGQIPADSEVLSGEIEVNESLVTGESDPVFKKAGDSLLSGSFVICGEAAAKVCKVGADSFAFSIMKGAKYLKKPVSKILISINKLVKIIAFIIIPLGIALFVDALFFADHRVSSTADSVNSAVAAVIGMIPQGLILLTSITMAVSVIRISRRSALMRDMYSAEALARTNILCLDKTGTITTGEMTVEQVIPLGNADLHEIEAALCALMHALPDKNPTATAIRSKFSGTGGTGTAGVVCGTWNAESITPFSSARKYSGASFTGRGSYTLGAPEYLNAPVPAEYTDKRTVALAHNNKAVALIIMSDIIRRDARRTLAFFDKQGVKIKIISGDNPLTVKNSAIAAGVKHADEAHSHVDMSKFSPSDTAKIAEIAEKYTIFGRTSPQMKLEIIKALKINNTVGMVGDGVNDVLPLKEADFSAAMQSGSEAARNVSSLVLLDNNFAGLPAAVAEGRRSINNLERGAALFLTKTIYALVLAAVFLYPAMPYPFIPIQMTLINGLFIGMPSFVLAFEKNSGVVKGDFLSNVLRNAVPNGLCAVLGISILAIFAKLLDFTYEETRTSATIVLGMASFVILCRICRPLNRQRFILVAISGILFSLAVEIFEDLLSVTAFTPQMHAVTFALCAAMLPACVVMPILTDKIYETYKRRRGQ
ncbi:MAG: cation-translocating P-type ATPase [Oscillospiraceae bacterium]|nr:cation-translocating P-type ATPase [Oscillospiraceae bacterium]